MFLEKVVQATVASLGYLENGIYSPEPDCFGDLSRCFNQCLIYSTFSWSS